MLRVAQAGRLKVQRSAAPRHLPRVMGVYVIRGACRHIALVAAAATYLQRQLQLSSQTPHFRFSRVYLLLSGANVTLCLCADDRHTYKLAIRVGEHWLDLMPGPRYRDAP